MAKFKKGNLWVSQNTEILSDGKTLTVNDKQQQFLDPNGQDRNVIMPAGCRFCWSFLLCY